MTIVSTSIHGSKMTTVFFLFTMVVWIALREIYYYSDHGKQNAQEKWIALMQMTPTRLVFFRNIENASLIGD